PTSSAKLSERARLATVAPTLSPMPNGYPVRAVQRNLHHQLLRSGVLITGSSRAGSPFARHERRARPAIHQAWRGSRAGFGASRSHRKRRIASTIATPLVAAKSDEQEVTLCRRKTTTKRSQRRERGQLPHPWVHPRCLHLALDVATLGVVIQTASTHETQR